MSTLTTGAVVACNPIATPVGVARSTPFPYGERYLATGVARARHRDPV